MVIYYFSYNQYTFPPFCLVEPNRKWKMSTKNYFIGGKFDRLLIIIYMVVLLRLYLAYIYIYMQLWIYNKINILQIHAPKNTVWTFVKKDSVSVSVEGKRGVILISMKFSFRQTEQSSSVSGPSVFSKVSNLSIPLLIFYISDWYIWISVY